MKKYILFLIIGLILAGCGSLTMQEQMEAQFYATAYARDGVIPPAKYQTLAATALGMYLPASPVPTATPNYNFTPTMSFYDYSGTQAAQVQNNAMTAQAQQQQYEMQKLKAEQAAEEARLAAQAHADSMTAQARATYMQGTANAEGTQVAGTAYAAGTATQFTWTINSQATGTSAAMTAVVLPTSDVLTLQAARIVQTIEAGQAEQVELSVKAQRATNYLKAFMWPAAFIGVIWVLGRGFAEFVKTRVHTRDEHGRTPLLQMKADNGDTIIVKPETLETGLMKVGKDGSVIRYAPMDKQEQSDITRRNQAIEAIAALPVPYASKGPQLLSGEFGRSAPKINFNNDPGLSPVLDEADNKFLEGSDE
jgi:hypothetical protein